jgi:hypothetical protein
MNPMAESTTHTGFHAQGHEAASARGKSMKSSTLTTIGELVTAAFDEAANDTADLQGRSHLATRAVTRPLRRARSRSAVTDVIKNILSDGCRFPAYGIPLPVGAQIRAALCAESALVLSAGRSEPAVGFPWPLS